MTDTTTAKADDKDDDKSASSKIVKRDDGTPVLDFASFADAVAQAKAIGKGAWTEAIGTAVRVHPSKDE